MNELSSTDIAEYFEHAGGLDTLQGILRCKCTFRYLLARNFKLLLTKRHDMFGNSEQDCYGAFQAICDKLDKATFTTLHFNNLYNSKVKNNFVGAMSIESICDNCKIVSVIDTEYREIYISLNIEEDVLQTQNFTRSQL